MSNKSKPLEFYLMGIGGTGMGAFAGLLKTKGYQVRGSDVGVYSPMKEKLKEWGIPYKTPYTSTNLKPKPDKVVVGNVIKKDNVEARFVLENNLPYDSFPSILNELFLQHADSLVVSGTHGKTTSASLLAHTLYYAGKDPGFLIGGIPKNFNESFRCSRLAHYPFVIEGDEYDTAFFDKKAKFFHYSPNYLLVTSLEFDHADIYKDMSALINEFSQLFATLEKTDLIIINADQQHIKEALSKSNTKANVISYGIKQGRYKAQAIKKTSFGSNFDVTDNGKGIGQLDLPLFGLHNIENALGCYVLLKEYGLNHKDIAEGFSTFEGVKRRLEEKHKSKDLIIVDDFAHHPSAVRETIRAAQDRYQNYKIVAIYEPRSATSCKKYFEKEYIKSLSLADHVVLAPVYRKMAREQMLDTKNIAKELNLIGIEAKSFHEYQGFFQYLENIKRPCVFLFMSNGDFSGHLRNMEHQPFFSSN